MNKPIIDVKNCWLDINTVAKIKSVTTRAVRLSIRNKKYIARTADQRGGKSYEVLLESLEPQFQNRYLNEMYKNVVLEEVEEPLHPIQVVQEKIIPESAKKIALARLDLIKIWYNFREGYKNKSKANKDFLQLYNTGEVHKEIYSLLANVSIGTLYRWNKDLGDYKTNDWTRLIPKYTYNKETEYRTSLTDEEIRIFMKILLHPNEFSIGKAIGLTKYILNKKGYELLPRDITFRRYAEFFKSKHYDKWVLAREGEKALKDRVAPYIVRDASVLEVGEVLVADGHKLNFQVVNPFTGHPTRATIVGFLDWKSGGFIGYEIMLEENTQCIASALRNSIIYLGFMPTIVYQDNGKAFKAKFFNGDVNFEELGFNGIYGNLGIKPVFAAPYNARAKVIERFFQEFQESFEKMMPSYIGSSIENKPAYMKRNEKLHKEIHNGYIPTIEETIRLIECWLEYRHSQPCSNVKGKTIQQVLDSAKKQKIDIDKLDDLMMAQEIKTIGRNGIRFLKSDYYDDNLYGIRGKSIVKYSLFDLSFVKVFSTKGEYLCTAKRVLPTHPMAKHLGDIKDMEDYKQKVVKQKQLKSKTIKAVKKLFTQEEIQLFSEKIEQEKLKEMEKNEENKENQPKLLVKIQPDNPLARPIFKNKYERYEWHLNNGCLDNSDEDWIKWYRTTDEYKMIYEEVK
ncbi:MAG: transposase [Cyanobacteriota bacterium]